MGRNAVKITQEELKHKIFEIIKKHPDCEDDFEDGEEPDNYNVASFFGYAHKKVMDDISKVCFDFENSECNTRSNPHTRKSPDTLMGLHTLDNGFTFWGMWAGGDWEYPVFFIVYWDGKGLRGYVPEDGNVYNKVFKTAFGSEGEYGDKTEVVASDRKKTLEMFPNYADEINKMFDDNEYDEIMDKMFDWAQLPEKDFDWKKIEQDIKGRIKVI